VSGDVDGGVWAREIPEAAERSDAVRNTRTQIFIVLAV
jgi:hypothetical protein